MATGETGFAEFFSNVTSEDSARAKQCHEFLKQLSGSQQSGPAVT